MIQNSSFTKSRFVRTLIHNPGVAVPFIMMLLMIGISVAVSKLVLIRLAETQAAHFRQLTGAFFDGLSTALQPYVLRRDPWEAFDVLDRARARYSGIDSLEVLVILPDDTVLATSDPMSHPLFTAAPPGAKTSREEPQLDHPGGSVWVHRVLREGGVAVGRIAASIDVTKFQQVRRDTLQTLVLFNTGLTLLFATLGWLLVRRMMLPLMRLSAHLARSADGRLEPIPDSEMPPADTDVGRAYRRFNTAAAAVSDREVLLQRLAEEERRALIGRYASTMAHEVNNPLGGMMNAVRMIQRHGDNADLRVGAAKLLERGLAGIHNVVRASLMTWRGEMDESPLTIADIEDIRYLIQSEAARRELTLQWSVDVVIPGGVAAQPIRQIALNLLLNACAASRPGSFVSFDARTDGRYFVLSVGDQGPGMPEDARRTLLDEAGHTGTSMPGLGLWAVSRIAKSIDARIATEGPPGNIVTVRIPLTIAAAMEKSVA